MISMSTYWLLYSTNYTINSWTLFSAILTTNLYSIISIHVYIYIYCNGMPVNMQEINSRSEKEEKEVTTQIVLSLASTAPALWAGNKYPCRENAGAWMPWHTANKHAVKRLHMQNLSLCSTRWTSLFSGWGKKRKKTKRNLQQTCSSHCE